MVGEDTKQRVLQAVAGSRTYASQGKAQYRIGNTTIHVRYCSKPSRAPSGYAYNINPNTLRSDHELWICGDADGWYLIPMQVIRSIYEDPLAYVDRRHPEIRVATVDVKNHDVIYGSGGLSTSFSAYRNGRLP